MKLIYGCEDVKNQWAPVLAQVEASNEERMVDALMGYIYPHGEMFDPAKHDLTDSFTILRDYEGSGFPVLHDEDDRLPLTDDSGNLDPMCARYLGWYVDAPDGRYFFDTRYVLSPDDYILVFT